MEGKDWLTFLGPIVLAIVTVVMPFVISKLQSRDRSARIRADLELLAQLPEELSHTRSALADSIDLRIRALAESSLPVGWRMPPYHLWVRRSRTVGLYTGIAGTLFGYTYFFYVHSVGQKAIAVGIALVGVVQALYQLDRRADLDMQQAKQNREKAWMAREMEAIRVKSSGEVAPSDEAVGGTTEDRADN